MASNPYVNKVVYGNSTLIDLSQDTATQADVAQGKYFHLPTGERVQGTASGGGGGSITQDQDGYLVLSPDGGGGGGGLEYEEGTFTPTQDVANPTIYFANNHTAPPMNIVFYDATGTADFTTDTEWVFTWNDLSQVGGTPISISSNSEAYARVSVTIRGSSTSSLSGWLYNILTPYSDTSESSESNYRYWVTTSMFRPFANQTTRYCRVGRTYKWIAVWAPTT